MKANARDCPSNTFDSLLKIAKEIQTPNSVALATHPLELNTNSIDRLVGQAPRCNIDFVGSQVYPTCGRCAGGGANTRPTDAQHGYSFGKSTPELGACPPALEIVRSIEHYENVGIA